ncbi:hypothetical protein CAPTEDRAFT_219860 [Capitella teleta]|uniref:Phosphatidylinositol N-acetylglucosaminyltransferase subunit H conserved domain-containing protein n=1 Tax=Capitella teleta TaxID=283909 RepID=R7TRN8_CAPTE|nr:hypothetical protein CAPTEDRAFT_219860 [Capitella teleta]|eukprot:ELT96583.1 hypothetical protein CAPTEDRAFT_219860 [Capitella teleta]
MVWKRTEAKTLEVIQREFGRWLWRVDRLDRSAWNAVVQGESGCSTFEEREVKAKMAFVRRILWGGSMVAEVGRAALLEIILQSGWWKEVERMALRFHWDELAHLIWRRRVSKTGREMCEIGGMERRKEIVCVERETEEHVLLDRVWYEHLREEWRERWRVEKGDQDMMERECNDRIKPCLAVVGEKTQYGEDIELHVIEHHPDICLEFVVTSTKFSIKTWIVWTTVFNILGFAFKLHLQDSQLMTFIVGVLCAVLLLKMNFKVTKESLLVTSSVGVQLTTTFASGRQSAKFYDIQRVVDVVINEAVTMHRVIAYLTLLLRDERSKSEISTLIPLFTHSWPSFNCLKQMHSRIHGVLSYDTKAAS